MTEDPIAVPLELSIKKSKKKPPPPAPKKKKNHGKQSKKKSKKGVNEVQPSLQATNRPNSDDGFVAPVVLVGGDGGSETLQ